MTSLFFYQSLGTTVRILHSLWTLFYVVLIVHLHDGMKPGTPSKYRSCLTSWQRPHSLYLVWYWRRPDPRNRSPNAIPRSSSMWLLIHLGLSLPTLPTQDAGYNYVNIDDCYAEKNRTADGDIVEGKSFLDHRPRVYDKLLHSQDHVRFKNGMKKLTKQVHALGL